MTAIISVCGTYRYTLERDLDFPYNEFTTLCTCECRLVEHFKSIPRLCAKCSREEKGRCTGFSPTEPAPTCMFVLVNPSTADAVKPDPTVTRCIGFGKSWGYGRLLIGNLHAFRTKSPKVLKEAFDAGTDTVGPDNDRHLLELAARASLIVCGWGNHGYLGGRDLIVKDLLQRAGHKLHYLKLTKQGRPEHPLYQKGDLKPTEWT